MYKKTSLVIALSAILLVGCGDEEANQPNDPSNEGEVQEEQDTGPRNDENGEVDQDAEEVPVEEENEMIGDDEFDMPDTQEQKEVETDLNK